jgi:Holliday junction resolvase RusA-like endonuclease
MTTACSIDIEIRCPIPQEWDQRAQNKAWAGTVRPVDDLSLSTIEALILMGITGIAIKDDRQVCQVTKQKSYSNAPRVVVTVSELDHG